MNYGGINKHDTANGPGIRVSLFVSGCEHHCKNCFNPETWDFSYGQEFTSETLKELIEAMSKYWIGGLTILGGEPMHPKNVIEVSKIVSRIKVDFPYKSIWVYSGYTLEELMERYQNMHLDPNLDPEVAFATGKILDTIDVLVDGKFVEELKDLKLRFKGSSNQRTINMRHYRVYGDIKEPDIPD